MPVPEQRLYSPNKLNRWFAFSSVIMTASLLWLIEIDYNRPWRGFQEGYFVDKAALAHLDYLDAMRSDRQQEIAEAEQRVRDAEELLEHTSGAKRRALETELVQVGLKFNVADGRWSRDSQVLEVTRDAYEKTLNRNGADNPKTKAANAKLLADDEKVSRLLAEKEKYQDEQTRIKGALEAITVGVRGLSKVVRDLRAVAESAMKKDREYRGVLEAGGLLGDLPIVSAVINAPLLDFLAAKTALRHEHVRQLVLPDIRQRLNYLETYTTDRCTTCHIAIDDPEFSKDRLARKLERSLPGINEELQRRGKDGLELPPVPLLTGEEKALPPGKVTDYWDKLDRPQQDAYFDVLLGMVNDYLKRTGRNAIDLGQPLLAHPDLDLYISVDSPHPMSAMGCTVCHEGNPQETDFVQAAHSAATHEQRELWEEEYYTSAMGLPNVTFETVEHFWDRPMRLREHTEAACAKCHSQITDIARFNGERRGARINQGRFLFTSVGCINCHQIEELPDARRVGPNLAYIAAKLQPEFVEQWIYFPQSFRPSTRMPHFFLQENNLDATGTPLDETPELRTETEVAAITKYLFSVSKEWTPIERPADVTGDADRGRKLFRSLGCLACHANLAEFGEEWITTDLVQRERLEEETARHRFLGMTYTQRVEYAMEHFPGDMDTFLHPEKARFDPNTDDNKPTFTRFAPELSGIGSKVSEDWLYSWVMEPTHYSPDTIMPSLRLLPGEAADIAAYLVTLKNADFEAGRFEINDERGREVDDLLFLLLSSQRSERASRSIIHDEGGELTEMIKALLVVSLDVEQAAEEKKWAAALVAPMSLEEKKLMYLGNKMIGHYGCYTCHNIYGFETTTPVGTELTAWAEKPISQLDFAFYDHAFHDMREQREEDFGYVYRQEDWASELRRRSPTDDDMREQITHTHAGFAKHKLLNPRIWDREKIKLPYDKLKMPNFYFTEDEADALSTYLLSRIPPRVNDVLKIDYKGGDLGPIAKGRNLTREFNCIACHEIEDNVPTIQQYFRRSIADEVEFDAVNAPPSLWGEGAKVQYNWFHRFLQQVEPLRPWLQVRMPSFNITGEQATVLAEYFAALSNKDAKELAAARTPVRAYMDSQAAQSVGASRNDAALAGTDWFEQDSLADEAADLRRWGVERKLIRAAEFDQLVAPHANVIDAHRRLLVGVDFMQSLYDVAYPFVEPPRVHAPREQFERGQRFFTDMGCLQCHVLGDMLPGPANNTDDFVQIYRLDAVRGEGEEAVATINGTPYPVGTVIDGLTMTGAETVVYPSGDVETKAYFSGTNKAGEDEQIMLQAASAPNLSLTYRRLRRSWVYQWMLQPGWIQPGTKMPQNFANGVSPFLGDPSYPGTSADHIHLLVDYLYQAGATSERADLPKLVIEDEGEFDEDDGALDDEDFDD